MSDYGRPRGPVEIAGARGQVLRVGSHQISRLEDRAAPGAGLYDQFQTTAEFAAAVRRDEEQLERDKAKVRELARRRRFAQGFADRRVEREQELFRTTDDGFPAPMDRRRR